MFSLISEMNQFTFIVFISFLLYKCNAIGANVEDDEYSKDLSAIENEEMDKQEDMLRDLSDEHKKERTTGPPIQPCGSYIMDPDESVVLMSKRFPKYYPKNQKCTWRFTCSSSNADMRLHCDSFALQNTRDCHADYLHISNSFHSFGNYCGKKGPKYLHSNSNYMKVNFRSNEDHITREGFHCILRCKEKIENKSLSVLNVHEFSTLIEEIALRHTFGQNSLHKEKKETSYDQEYIDTVLEDLAASSEKIFSNKKVIKLPILKPNNTLTTIINKLASYPKLELVSSYYEEHEEASAFKWIGQLASKVHSSQVAALAVDCGSHLIPPGEKIYFQSPKYPKIYPKNYQCTWNFNCELENTIIELNCEDYFELQKNPICHTDYIQALDKSGSIRRSCGKDAPKALTSSTNFMSVVFRTNWDTIRRAGFSCNVKCNDIATTESTKIKLAAEPKVKDDIPSFERDEVNSEMEYTGKSASQLYASKRTKSLAAECGSHLINPGEKLYFQSPNYPKKYPKNYKCAWKVNCSWENAIMELNCDDHFELQKNKICFTDYIETFDKSGPIKKNCGRDAPKNLTTNSNFMRVVFKTNWDKIRRAGFSCNVMCHGITTTTAKSVENPLPTTTSDPSTTIPPTTTNPPTSTDIISTSSNPDTTTNNPTTTPSPPLPCGKYIIEPSETVYFESVNYPKKYVYNETCKWRFTCSAMSSMIEVDCPDFYIESHHKCRKDYLQIKDESIKLGTYCGKEGPSNLVSYSNILKVMFVSDHEKNKGGFRCSVRCTYIETPTISTFGFEIKP